MEDWGFYIFISIIGTFLWGLVFYTMQEPSITNFNKLKIIERRLEKIEKILNKDCENIKVIEK